MILTIKHLNIFPPERTTGDYIKEEHSLLCLICELRVLFWKYFLKYILSILLNVQQLNIHWEFISITKIKGFTNFKY